MEQWLSNCQICNDGLIIRIEELKKEGHSERSAAHLMELQALKAYPEMKHEFNEEKLRARYRYHFHIKGAKKDVGENLPPLVEAPKCIRCDGKPAILSKKTGKRMTHGLCRKCKADDNGKQNSQNPPKVSKKAQDEFDQKSINQEAEKYWSDVASKIEDLLKDPVIGKVGSEIFRKVKSVQGLMDQFVDLLEEESTP